jgi:hypothetical protein
MARDIRGGYDRGDPAVEAPEYIRRRTPLWEAGSVRVLRSRRAAPSGSERAGIVALTADIKGPLIRSRATLPYEHASGTEAAACFPPLSGFSHGLSLSMTASGASPVV